MAQILRKAKVKIYSLLYTERKMQLSFSLEYTLQVLQNTDWNADPVGT